MPDNRVRASLLEGMRDLQNLLVHLQEALMANRIPLARSGGGLTFSGYSIKVSATAPVEWIGHYIDRPGILIYQILDRELPPDCPLTDVRKVEKRRYERIFQLDEGFFESDERAQVLRIQKFISETASYLNDLPCAEDIEA